MGTGDTPFKTDLLSIYVGDGNRCGEPLGQHARVGPHVCLCLVWWKCSHVLYIHLQAHLTLANSVNLHIELCVIIIFFVKPKHFFSTSLINLCLLEYKISKNTVSNYMSESLQIIHF